MGIIGRPNLDWDVLFDEDFMSTNASGTVLPGPGGTAGDNVGAYTWDVINDDDGPFRGLASEVSHPGIVQIECAIAANMRVSASRTSTGPQCPLFDMSEVFFLRCVFRIPTTSSLITSNCGIGLTAGNTDAEVSGTNPLLGNTGLVFHKPSSNANWLTRRVTGGTGVGTSTGRAAVLGDWIDARLKNKGGGTWQLWVNGNDLGNIVTGVATSGMVAPLFWMSNTAVGTRRFDVDKFTVGLLMSQRHTP